ncbi:Short-chain dehydrogenase [Psilocybe cubensis]|uniref:NAD(P)-binding protein n=2 Tax=Psilocybe cubensis TaxID=181762 RepID=A0A8H7XP78_PSICU|nr:Short-chain dehydrogenase [Psilocybe cubensis]KAH9478058.1 Short-chain dehydrogenase [Psilocybe cubensis]
MASPTPARRIAFITGSAQGIGRAIALRLAEDGYDVALNDIPKFESELNEVSELIKANTKSQAKTYIHIADVTIQKEINAAIDAVVENLGGLDVMVANAGICIVKPFLEVTTEDWDRIFAINTRAAFFAYQYAAKVMIKQGRGGRIIGACSGAGMQASPMLSAYSSTKFALRGLTQAAAGELGQYGITVNAYAPGPIVTPMLNGVGDSLGGKDAVFAAEAARIPVGYIGKPEDVAGLVSYLASKESHFVNGENHSAENIATGALLMHDSLFMGS